MEIHICLPPQGSSGWDWISGVGDTHVYRRSLTLGEITQPAQSSTFNAHESFFLLLSHSLQRQRAGNRPVRCTVLQQLSSIWNIPGVSRFYSETVRFAYWFKRIYRLPFSVHWKVMVTVAVEQDFHSLLKFLVWFIHKAIVLDMKNQNKSRLDNFYDAFFFLSFLQLESSWSSLLHGREWHSYQLCFTKECKWWFYIFIFGWIIPWNKIGVNRFGLLSMMVSLSTTLKNKIDYNFYQKL